MTPPQVRRHTSTCVRCQARNAHIVLDPHQRRALQHPHPLKFITGLYGTGKVRRVGAIGWYILYFQTVLAMILARLAVEKQRVKKLIVICMDNGREGSGLLDHFKMNIPAKRNGSEETLSHVEVTYLSRTEAAKKFEIVQKEN